MNGKIGSDGKTYFQVYITFTEKRESYRLKSQLVTRPITKQEFDNLTHLYDGKISDLLDKERIILYHCLRENTDGESFDRNQFRKDYIHLTKSLIYIVREFRTSIPISNWSIPAVSWELTKKLEIESELLQFNSKKNFQDEDLFELEINMLEYQLEMRKNDLIHGLFLVYDWKNGNLKRDFNTFLKSRCNRSRSSELFALLNTIVA